MSAGGARFLQLLNEQNERIAARKAEEEAEREARGEDQIRLQRQEERRERLGTLRAREHPSRRVRKVIGNAFGYVNLDY